MKQRALRVVAVLVGCTVSSLTWAQGSVDGASSGGSASSAAPPLEAGPPPVREVGSGASAGEPAEASPQAVEEGARREDSTPMSESTSTDVPPTPEEDYSGDEDEEGQANRPAPNSFYLEGLGAGLFYSFNYERRVIDDVGVRVGFSYIGVGVGNATTTANAVLMTFPITVSYLGVRAGKHGLELGAGGTILYAGAGVTSPGVNSTADGAAAWADLLVGYRLHPVGTAGFQFRAGLNMIMAFQGGVTVFPWPYVSCGISF